jgi:hypothetical protein
MEALDRSLWASSQSGAFANESDDPIAVYASLYDFHLGPPAVDQASSIHLETRSGRGNIVSIREIRDALDGVSDFRTPLSRGVPHAIDDDWFAVVATRKGAPAACLVGYRAHPDAEYAEIALLWTARTLSIGSPLISQLELMRLWLEFMHLASNVGYVGLFARIVDQLLRATLTSGYPRFLPLKAAIATRERGPSLTSVPVPMAPQFEIVPPAAELSGATSSGTRYFVLPTNEDNRVAVSDTPIEGEPWRIRPTAQDLARWKGQSFAALFGSGLIAQAFDLSPVGAIQFEQYMWTQSPRVQAWKGTL